MIRTKLTEMLGIEYPIVQGCMQWISRAPLVAAVSEAGGLGLLSSSTFSSADELQAEIRKIKSMTSKPFAVNLTLMPSLVVPDYAGYIRVCAEEGVKVMETAGRPPKDDMVRAIKDAGMVHGHPHFPVYVDSPLAKKATTIFCGDLRGYLDEDARALVQDGTHMFNFPGLHLTETVDESKLLNIDKTPKVIISASGMCDAGRIRHHLKYNLWRGDSAVVFVGFQAPGTLGRNLLDGTPSVKLFGEEIAVRAKIVNFQGLSSHADHDHLVDWVKHFSPEKTTHVFVVHGDREVAPVFAETVKQLGFAAHAPQYTEEYDLIADQKLAVGYLPERKARAYEGAPKAAPAYQKLVQMGDMLIGLIRRSKGRDNKSLAAFAEAISKIINKFEF